MKKADYGLDAPGVILGATGAGLVIGALTLVFRPVHGLIWLALGLVVLGVATHLSSRYGKLHIAERVLDGLSLRGDEHVLDVGCGRGLLLVGAAKRLRVGRAVGLDLWSQVDQLDNRRDATLDNAALEGVAERIRVVDGDMRQMPFADACFDLILSNLAIHNVPGEAARKQSVLEIVRVLKPGGRVALMDLAFTGAYQKWLTEAGLVEVRREWPARWFFPPLGIVTARKLGPASAAQAV